MAADQVHIPPRLVFGSDSGVDRPGCAVGTAEYQPGCWMPDPRSEARESRPNERHGLGSQPPGTIRDQRIKATTGFKPVNRGFADLRVEPLHHVASTDETT